MNIKQKYLFLITLGVMILLISGAYAFTLDLGQGMNQVIGWISGFFGALFSAILGGDGQYLFERIMLFVIILAFTKSILSQVPVFKDKNKAAVWIISVIVSILAARLGFSSEYLQTIFLPYTVLGIAISAIVPFIIYFYFVGSFDSSTLRKIMWVFYAVLFFILWYIRLDQVGTLAWIYFWAAVAGLVLFFFDGTIRRAIIRGEYERLEDDGRQREIVNLNGEIRELGKKFTAGDMTQKFYEKEVKRLEQRRAVLQEKH